MKVFIVDSFVVKTSTCTFTAPGGSGAPPPASVPSYMGVLVTGSATKPLDAVNGAWSHIVVVKTDPGYSPSAGKAGTGTIVATYC